MYANKLLQFNVIHTIIDVSLRYATGVKDRAK